MSIATIVYEEMEEGDQFPGRRMGEVTDNFFIVWADDEGVYRHWSGPGPWPELAAMLGPTLEVGEDPRPDNWGRVMAVTSGELEDGEHN